MIHSCKYLEIKKLKIRKVEARKLCLKMLLTSIFYIVTSYTQAQILEDYLNEAAENNPSLKASYATFEASMKRMAQVNSLPDPKLSFGYFVSPIETRIGAQQAKISLTQMFPWFGTLKAKEQVAALQSEAVYQTFIDKKHELFFKVKQAYYPLYKVNEHIQLQERNLEILESFQQLATTSFSSGKAAMTDVIRVEIMIEDVKTDIQILKDNIKPLETAFNLLLNRADTLDVSISDTLVIDKSLVYFQKDSLASYNPKIKTLEKKLASLKAQELVAQKSGLPQIGIGLDYAFITERKDMNISGNGRDALMPMITMSIPIFRKKYNAAIEESQLLQKSVQYQIEGTENQLITRYETSLFEADKSIQLDYLYSLQSQKTEQALNLLYTDYSNSGKDFEEVLRMQQQLLKYEMAQATVRTQFHIALAQLAYITAKSE